MVRSASATHRVACGLLFGAIDRQLLVGTDASSLAMVLSEDPDLIDRYRRNCEALESDEYFDSARD